MVIEKQKEYDNKITYLVKNNRDKFLLNIYVKDKYDSSKDLDNDKVDEISKYKYGDCLQVKGKIVILEMLGNIGEFNYKRYLNSKDICGSINAYEVEYVENAGNKSIKLIYLFKEKVGQIINKNLKSKEAELLKSMLYGDTTSLDDNIKTSFNEIGISHITAVSGSNLSILLLIISFVLYKLKNKRIYNIIQIFVIIIFCIFSSLELSVIRAGIMSIMCIILKNKNITIPTEKVLLITLYVMTFSNPYRIFNIGMIFSFLAILGLSFFSSKIYNFLESKIKWNIQNKVIVKILLYISSILSITISVNIFVLPISVYSFNKFSLMFILSNLLISTIASCINALGIISIILSKIPLISTLCFKILDVLLKLVIQISDILDNINISIQVKSFPIIILIFYYLYLTVICINMRYNKRYIKEKIGKIKKGLLIILVITICITNIQNIFFNNYIYFFNVGQGEMSIIKNKSAVIMIDSGSITNSTSYIFKSYMQKENINKIDALVISHFHEDHINGIEEIAKLCDIEYVIYSYPYDLKSEKYINLLNIFKDKKIKQIQVKAGDNININGIEINILFPKDRYITVSDIIDENENANSLVLNIAINNKNYLFMGDSLKKSEEYIVEELKKQNISNVEIIKIGHHGSKTSTSEQLIQTILPNYAVILSKKKVYNHPSKETIQILNKYSVITYITEKVGGIKYII